MTLSESQHAAYSRHWNPGQLPADWTLEKLMAKHASHPFNPDIANAFFRAGLIESWGRGIERITEIELQDNPAANHFKAVVRRLPADDTLAENAKAESKAESLEVRVLRALQSGPLSKAALVQALGMRKVTGQLNQQVRDLLSRGHVEMTLPDTPRSRLQKYRLTAAGQRLQAALRPGQAAQQAGKGGAP